MLRNLQSVSSRYVSRAITRSIKTTCQLSQTDGERRITDLIKASYLKPSAVEVVDISGGCGSMYQVYVSSREFKGKRTIQQHRIVNEILKEEVVKMHGLRINTEIPKDD
eukprot:gene19022-20935_t